MRPEGLSSMSVSRSLGLRLTMLQSRSLNLNPEAILQPVVVEEFASIACRLQCLPTSTDLQCHRPSKRCENIWQLASLADHLSLCHGHDPYSIARREVVYLIELAGERQPSTPNPQPFSGWIVPKPCLVRVRESKPFSAQECPASRAQHDPPGTLTPQSLQRVSDKRKEHRRDKGG